jgi:DNA topoisomerase-3
MAVLILAEKPDLMRKVADAIAGAAVTKKDGFIESKDGRYVFSHALGHLTSEKMPDSIDPSLKKWSASALPFWFDDVPLEVKPTAREQFAVVSRLLKDARFDEVIDCCDADREGEAIFRNIVEVAKARPKKMTRMWIKSSTPDGIREAFASRKPESAYDDLASAAKARAVADYHVGLNATRLMTCLFGGGKVLQLGRVKTPTLRMVVDRDAEISSFKAGRFWRVKAQFRGSSGDEWTGFYVDDERKDGRFDSKEDAQALADAIDTSKDFSVSVEEKEADREVPLLYSLSDLQSKLSASCGMTAKQTLDAVQSLYEKHSMVTYPRTDENHMSSEMEKRCDYILRCIPSGFRETKEILGRSHSVNPKSVSGKGDEIGSHEALMPTECRSAESSYRSLTRDEKAAYDAICERFLEQFYGPCRMIRQTVTAEQAGKRFIAKAESIIDPGWTAVGGSADDAPADADARIGLIEAKDGSSARAGHPELAEGTTVPPSPFTEGTLIRTMKSPLKYAAADDRDILRKVQGIGTEATRAAIIEQLKANGLLQACGKKIVSTQAGKDLIAAIPTEGIKSVGLTASFESKLEMIAMGSYSPETFLSEIRSFDERLAKEAKEAKSSGAAKEIGAGRKAIAKCVCGGNIVDDRWSWHCDRCARSISKDGLSRIFKGPKMTEAQAKELFLRGITSRKLRMTSLKSGKSFEAYLTYRFEPSEKYPNNLFIGFEKPSGLKGGD